jgi:CRISPR-associated protein Cmr2
MNEQAMWQAKVLAYLHDPAEKALVLLRGKGHEAGTVAAMKELLGEDLERAYRAAEGLEALVKQADRWAAAADRPSLPRGLGGKVVFSTDPQIIHPLTGERIRLAELAGEAEASVPALEAVSFDHFRGLLVHDGHGVVDWRRTLFRLWRFGPVSPAPGLGVLWNLLPADTRSPDHTIWEHLKLTSAFAGSLAAGAGGPALLLMSFGPVQEFIAQARSASDLWAGSHLLSRIAWQAMALVCERFGPDAVLFPDLHGVALADLWLRDQVGEWPDGVSRPWADRADDTNPLFAAALPNRFVALVPADEAAALAGEIARGVRSWVREKAEAAWAQVTRAAGREVAAAHAREQISRQLDGFPEVHWAAVPWHLAGAEGLDDGALKEVLRRLGAEPAYLDPALEKLLRGEIRAGGHVFYAPNPGVGYPGLYEAAERLHGAAKAARPFDGGVETGYRCTLCGEREWLTDDAGLLDQPKGEREGRSIWDAAGRKEPALAKAGEHLCAPCALKRCWPRLFVDEARSALPDIGGLQRFVLSTRTVALSTTLWRWVEKGGVEPWPGEPDIGHQKRREAGKKLRAFDLAGYRAALPLRLHRRLQEKAPGDRGLLRALPAWLDDLRERARDEREAGQAEELTRLAEAFLGGKPETYYGLILMDGDRMGAWLAGDEGGLPLRARFHETTLQNFEAAGPLRAYLDTPRPASPARHQAISTALNGFALHLARVVVEDLFLGKLIYAGGDDLLAMVAVHDLPGLLWALRCAYSGVLPAGLDHARFWQAVGAVEDGRPQDRLRLSKGFALLRDHNGKRLLRLMGGRATASIGAVVAHHQAPLARVLADLRSAERRAKTDGGRDAFCLAVEKRAGGTTRLVGKWRMNAGADGDLGLLLAARDFLARGLSRRAVYHLAERLRDVPADPAALEAVLRYQFTRQARGEEAKTEGKVLAGRLARGAVGRSPASGEPEWPGPNRWLCDLLITAEFLAREGRVESPAQREI